MELRVLQYFLAVAEEGSLSGAAERLNITQPTLSRQLAGLEEELGTQLYHRGSRGVALTEDGLRLKLRAQEILSLEERTRAEITGGSEEVRGEIAIGCAETGNMRLLSVRCNAPALLGEIRGLGADGLTACAERGDRP
ncbi:MAG: LysR family transcriptional regulator [Lachnospiraceae bacterium]|nr:LysR family transcriptional regulator [Lachnospiraceae bacterium]